MGVFVFVICLLASSIGGICGIGGGIIIKPVLDAMNIMSVSAISFLSGLTVMSMSIISVFRQRKDRLVELKTGTALAAGAMIGGIAGNALFHVIKDAAGNDSYVGMIQNSVLALVTLFTLIYSVWLRRKIPSYHVEKPMACTLVGMCMGVLSAFLGIGGGPINLAILYFAFSMDTKKAAANSLYIIMFSQIASFTTSCIKGTIPAFPWQYLLLMVSAGVLGGTIGSQINRKVSAETTDRLFAGLLSVIVLICIVNARRLA